jgi:hypothetical protein
MNLPLWNGTISQNGVRSGVFFIAFEPERRKRSQNLNLIASSATID